MLIGLVDVDGHAKKKKWGATIYPNLALAKIARYWRNRGGQIEWATPMKHYDIIYMSKVADSHSCREFVHLCICSDTRN